MIRLHYWHKDNCLATNWLDSKYPEEFPEGCYSPEEFNCLVVDTYKKGFPLMKKQYLERVEKGDISPMKAGPGEGLIFNRDMVSDVLEKPSMPRKHPRLP